MAGRPSTELDNTAEFNESTITAIVRRVYSSLNEVQPASQARATLNLGVRTNTSNSVEEEMSQRFSLPRGSARGQGRSLTPLENRPILDDSTRYNPQINYGNSRLAKGKGKGKASKAKETVVNKELILLHYPTYTQVPRYEHKRKLQDLGLIIDGFPLEKSWDENQLRLKVFLLNFLNLESSFAMEGEGWKGGSMQ